MQSLLIEMAQQGLRLLRGEVERGERRRLGVIQIVPSRPAEGCARRRRWPVPFAADLVRVGVLHQGLGGAVAEGLVAAAHGVVIERQGVEIHMRKIVAKIPSPYARHAEAGQCRNLVEAHFQALVVGERVDVFVGRSRAVPSDQQRDAFVQIVHDGRMPVEEHALDRLGRLMGQLSGISIDVDECVLGPVGRRLPRQRRTIGFPFQEPVEPFDLLVAAVRIRHRIDEHDQVLADPPDHRLLGNSQAIGELQHCLGGARLVGVQTGIEIVNRPSFLDEPLRRRQIRLAGIGECRGSRLQALQIRNSLLIGDGEQHDVAALLGAPDGEHPDARRCRGERAAVGVGGGGVDQFARCPRDSMQKRARRWNGRGGRQVRNPRREESRFGGGRGDFGAGGGIGGVRRRRLSLESARQRQQHHQRAVEFPEHVRFLGRYSWLEWDVRSSAFRS